MDMNDLNHYCHKKIHNGKNVVWPYFPKNPKRILDVGTGSGLWAKDMAKEYPKCTVHGLDMMEDIINKIGAPDNVVWDIANILERTPYPDNYFDFIHFRYMIGGIPEAKMQAVCDEMFRITKRGGSITMIDPTNIFINEGPLHKKWHNTLLELCYRLGINCFIPAKYEECFLQAGYKETHVLKYTRAKGNWGGDLGAILADVAMRMTLMMPIMAPDLITPEEAVKLNQDCMAEEVNQYRTEAEYVYVSGKKT